MENGGKEGNVHEIERDFAYNNNVHSANINIRMGFLRKVYGLLSVQLLITIAVTATFMAIEPLKLFVQTNPWMLLPSFLLTIGTLLALHVKRREHPVNLILLTAFTVVEAYTVAVVVSTFDTSTVLEALFVTLTVVVCLTLYTFQSKRDYSFLGFGLFAGLWVLLLGGFMQIFLQSSALEIALSVGGAALFSMFIVFDTHLLMRVLSPEEYILATINIYLDIINLFLHILRIIAAVKE